MSTDRHGLKDILKTGETLSVEFKSDQNCLPDRELVATIVALANTEGGDLYLGVEDNGSVTGLHANHLYTTGLSALISNRTNPPVSVRVEMLEYEGMLIARVRVYSAQIQTVSFHLGGIAAATEVAR